MIEFPVKRRPSYQVEQLDHVALTVSDIARSVQWYQDVLGLRRLHEDVWGNFPAVLGIGGTSLALFPVSGEIPLGSNGQPPIAVRHIAFRADRANFDSVVKELPDKGIAIRFEDHDIAHSIYFTDPDGHQLEITTYEISPGSDGRGPDTVEGT